MTVLRRLWASALLATTYVGELVRANVEMVRMVLTPGLAEPAVIAVELQTDDPWLITTFTNLVSLTPGTLTIEVDASHAYIHVLSVRPLEDVRADVMDLRRRVLRVTDKGPR